MQHKTLTKEIEENYRAIEKTVLDREEASRFYQLDLYFHLKEKKSSLTEEERKAMDDINQKRLQNHENGKFRSMKSELSTIPEMITKLQKEIQTLKNNITPEKYDELLENIKQLKTQENQLHTLETALKNNELLPEEKATLQTLKQSIPKQKQHLESICHKAPSISDPEEIIKKISLQNSSLLDMEERLADAKNFLENDGTKKSEDYDAFLNENQKNISQKMVLIERFVNMNRETFKGNLESIVKSSHYQNTIDAVTDFRKKSDPLYNKLTLANLNDIQAYEKVIRQSVIDNPERILQYEHNYRSQVIAMYNENLSFKKCIDKNTPLPENLNHELLQRTFKRTMAFEFTFESIKKEGWPTDVRQQRQRAENYVRGISFEHPDDIIIERIQPDKILVQYQDKKSKWQGLFYWDRADNPNPHTLGVGALDNRSAKSAFSKDVENIGKGEKNYIATNEMFSLKSKAGPIVDNWSMGEGKEVLVKGGAIQRYIPEKPAFISEETLKETLQSLIEKAKTANPNIEMARYKSALNKEDVALANQTEERLEKIKKHTAAFTIIKFMNQSSQSPAFQKMKEANKKIKEKNKLAHDQAKRAEQYAERYVNKSLSASASYKSMFSGLGIKASQVKSEVKSAPENVPKVSIPSPENTSKASISTPEKKSLQSNDTEVATYTTSRRAFK